MINVDFPPLSKIINQKFIPIFYNSDRYLLLWGGRGSSKSDFTAKKKIYECLTFPYFRDILIRDTYATIKDSQYQTIKDIIHDWGIQSLFRFKENPLEIHCVNGNKFYARGCDDVEKIKSIKDPTGAWYEEANSIDESDFITITTSIRTSKAKYLQEILSFNPECTGNYEDFWIYRMFLKDQKEPVFSSFLEIELPDGTIHKTSYTSHHSTYKDNRWCKPGFISFLEQLRTINPYFYDVYCLGLWGTKQVTNPFATQYDPKRHEGKASFDPNDRLIISIDFNLNPFACSFANLWKDSRGVEHLHIFDSIKIPNASIDKMIEQIKAKFQNQLPNCILTGDSVGNNSQLGRADNASFYRQLQMGLGIRPNQVVVINNPTHKVSRADCNYILQHFPDVTIDSVKCADLCMDMRTVECDDFGSIIKSNRNNLSQRADFCDTFRYIVNTFLRKWIARHQNIKK